MVLCSPDWGAHGGNEYWQNLLDRLTISSVRFFALNGAFCGWPGRSALFGYLMRPSTCLWGVRRLLGNADGGVC